MNSNNQIQTIIFDFGNVLLDWDVRYLYRKYFTDEEKLEYFLKEIDFYHWNLKMDAGVKFEDAIEQLTSDFPQWASMIRLYHDCYEETLRGAIDGSVAVLQRLHLSGWPLFGLSNFSLEKFSQIRPHYPFFDLFREIVLSGEVGVLKPDPAIFNILLTRIGFQPERCLFIDDSAANVKSAISLGMDAIQFRSAPDLVEQLHLRRIDVQLQK